MAFMILALFPLLVFARPQYTATYQVDNLPNQSEQGQTGSNKCGTTNSQDSMCQNVYVNSINDFCLWGPPTVNSVGNAEREMVSYCLQQHGTRTLPQDSLTGVHWIQTPDYVQVTGVGNFQSINIQQGDEGGELDPHGADGNGNPIGGLVFSSAFTGSPVQVHEWTNFMSATEFCIRACSPSSANGWELCQHIYDVMGCEWNMPGNYNAGSFDACLGDTALPPGVYDGSTFHQGDAYTPPAHPDPASSSCSSIANLGQSLTIQGPTATPTSPPSSTATGTGTTTDWSGDDSGSSADGDDGSSGSSAASDGSQDGSDSGDGSDQGDGSDDGSGSGDDGSSSDSWGDDGSQSTGAWGASISMSSAATSFSTSTRASSTSRSANVGAASASVVKSSASTQSLSLCLAMLSGLAVVAISL